MGVEGNGKIIAPNHQIQVFKVRFSLIEPSNRKNLFKSPSKMQNKFMEAGIHSLDKAPASKELVSSLLTLYYEYVAIKNKGCAKKRNSL